MCTTELLTSQRRTSTGGDAPLCLVNDRKARISAACELLWADGEPPYYSAVYPEHKYNFFLYYKGDAEEYAPEQRTQGSITKFFRIDGTQDLISAYARPGTEDAERLPDNDETKYLMNHAGDLVYSTKSARLHVEPHLRVKHEMAQVNFKVQAFDDLGRPRARDTHTGRGLSHPHEGAIHRGRRLGGGVP